MTRGGKRLGSGRPPGRGPYNEATKPMRIPLSFIPAVQAYIANKAYQLPLYGMKVAAGSPATADDHIEDKLDLNEFLIKHPSTTFLVRANGLSMLGAGIHENDLLIVDSSILPSNGKIVIAAINGQLTVKRFRKADGKLQLLPDNPTYAPINITEEANLHIWGVVTNVIHAL
jgi:DNA polymerase V